MNVVAQSCRLATNPRTGEPFSIVASDGEAESKERAGWPVVDYVPVASFERVAKLAAWIERDRREPDKVIAYAQELASLATRWGQ